MTIEPDKLLFGIFFWCFVFFVTGCFVGYGMGFRQAEKIERERP